MPHGPICSPPNSLAAVSFFRPHCKLFTAHESLFQRAAGQLTPKCHANVVRVIVNDGLRQVARQLSELDTPDETENERESV